MMKEIHAKLSGIVENGHLASDPNAVMFIIESGKVVYKLRADLLKTHKTSSVADLIKKLTAAESELKKAQTKMRQSGTFETFEKRAQEAGELDLRYQELEYVYGCYKELIIGEYKAIAKREAAVEARAKKLKEAKRLKK